MKRRYRQVRQSYWDEDEAKWFYQLQYSYFGVLWTCIGPHRETEEEIDEYFKKFVLSSKWVKYYE